MLGLHSTEIGTVFILVALILGLARAFGELAVRLGQPIIVGELLAGVILGPSVLGSVYPQLSSALLPKAGEASMVLDGLRTLSVALLLFVAGLEVEFSGLWRQRARIAITSAMGFVVPFVAGLLVAMLFIPAHHLGTQPMLSALFLSTALTISSLPVIARILLDLGLFQTRIGIVIMMSATVDDIIGWFILSVLLTLSTASSVSWASAGTAGALTLSFTVIMLTVGRWLVDRLLLWLRPRITGPGGLIGLVLVSALSGAALTEAIGIHAIFGAFLVGIAIGGSKHLDQPSRDVIKLFVINFFAPLYFATIGLQLDFRQHFDLQLTALLLAVACFAKIGGCGLGGYWSGLPKDEALAVGLGLNTRGMMTIIFSTIAFQYSLINESLLVAFISLAIFTSLMTAPTLEYVLKGRRPRLVLTAATAATKESR